MTEQERNKQVVRDYFDQCWDKANLDFGRTIIADDFKVHLPLPPGAPGGYELWRMGVGEFNKAFRDVHWDIRQIVAEDDLVSVRTVWKGVHVGTFMNIPASGNRVTAANSDYYRLRDGKFIEHWDLVDYLSVVRQLGGRMEDLPPMFAASTDD